jgi:PAS domain S-box-containing protein
MPDGVKTHSIKVTEEKMEIEENLLAPETEAGIVVGDLWGYISDVNQAVVKMYGAKDKSEFIGKHALEFLVKEEKARATQNSLGSIANNQPHKNKYRVRLRSGAEVAVEITSDFIRNKKGENIGFIDIITPISDP